MGRPLLGRALRDAFPEVVSQGYIEVMDEVFRSGVPYFAAERPVLIDVGGGALEERYYNVGYQPLRDAAGNVYAIASVSYDVSDHMQARREVEVARAQAETRRDQLDAVLAQTPVGVVIVEAPSGRALVINDAAARIYGHRTPTTSMDRYSVDWVGYRRDGSRIASHEWPLARVIGEGVTVASEIIENERPYGERVLVDVSAAPVRDAAGRLTAGVAIVVDITARVQAETERERLLRALEIERARLAYVFDKAPAFLAVLRGPTHVFELVNDAYYQLVGHRPLLGRPVDEALPEVRTQGFSDLLDGVLASGEPFIGRELSVFLARTPDAPPEERFVDFVYLPLVDADGTCSGVIAHGTDVTAQVLARRDVERLLAVAEAANRAKSDFLAVMSHELRTPLNAIGGYAELMEMGIRGPVTAEQRDDLRRIQTSQRHLLGLINEVLNYAKLETGTVHYDVVDVRVREPLTAAESLVAPQARAKGLTLAVGDCPPTLTARADLEKLRQIFVNLLSNAVKFTDRGGVTVDADADDARVYVRVRDTGIGIPADKLEAIFEPFTQVRADLTRPHEGTGLGLAISRDLARGMGGDLTVESALGGGSTFVLSLPKA
jgi:PAS domain S-box-containing protein